MKNIKINLALVAVLFAASAAFAFKAPTPKKAFAPLWQYDGSGSTTDASNYFEVASTSCPSGSANICAIMAPANAADPDVPLISTALSNRITAKNTSSGDVFLRN
jgi:hypothetical protein